MTITSEVFRLVGIYRHTGDREAFDAALDKLYAPPPEDTCSWCGATDSDTEDMEFEWPGLVDIEITVAQYEEGYSHVKKFVCSKDYYKVIPPLVELGFGDHRHGGICHLEADDAECGGYGKCTLGDPDE